MSNLKIVAPPPVVNLEEVVLYGEPPLDVHPKKVVHADSGASADLDEVTLINPPALNVHPQKVVHAAYSSLPIVIL